MQDVFTNIKNKSCHHEYSVIEHTSKYLHFKRKKPILSLHLWTRHLEDCSFDTFDTFEICDNHVNTLFPRESAESKGLVSYHRFRPKE